MIYLIKSAGYDENENLIHLLKIGYTEDNNRDRRFNAYKLHNPTCKILYELPELTEEDEKNIQYKFRKYLYIDYGREWFEYNYEIEELEMDILSEDYYNIRAGKTWKVLILYQGTSDCLGNINKVLKEDLEYFRKRVIKLNETYLNGEVSSMENYDRKILRWCFQSEDPEFSSKFFKYLNKLLNGNKT